MFASFTALTALLASTGIFVHAAVTPLSPAPGDIFNEGSTCHIAWSVDTTGQWKTLNIELMTGDNINMVHLTTVATLDGTTVNHYDYTCPDVTINSAIYFYQFTSPNTPDRFWTGRFAIADTTGHTTPPSEQTQPDGSPIPWGTGALVDPSTATPPPPYLTGNTSITATPPTAVPSSTASSLVSSSFSSSFVATSTVDVASTTSESPSSSASTASGAIGRLAVDSAIWHAITALGAAACAFTFLA